MEKFRYYIVVIEVRGKLAVPQAIHKCNGVNECK